MNKCLLAWLALAGLLLATLVHGQSQFSSSSSAAASSGTSSTGVTTTTQSTTVISTGSTTAGSSANTASSADEDGASKSPVTGTDAEGTEASAGSSVVAPPGEDAVVASRSVINLDGAAAAAVAGSDDEVIESSAVTPVDELMYEDYVSPAAEPLDSSLEDLQNTIVPEELDLCLGLAKFKCCDDEDFVEDGSRLFCGCWGSDVTQGCEFEVMAKSIPYVVKDLRSSVSGGACRCKEPNEIVEEECFGRTKISCCDEVKPGATACRCLFRDIRCIYEKRPNGVWHNTVFPNSDCVCPI